MQSHLAPMIGTSRLVYVWLVYAGEVAASRGGGELIGV